MWKIRILGAVRNLIKNRMVSLINITCLAIGLACAVFAIIFAYHELTFEDYHRKADQISRVYSLGEFGPMKEIPVTFAPVASDLMKRYPEIENVARSRAVGGIVYQDGIIPVNENNIMVADNSVFSLFTFEFIHGAKPTQPNEIVLSEQLANKYLGGNALGSILKIRLYGQKYDFVVKGIYKDFPSNTHLVSSIILPFEAAAQFGWMLDEYYDTSYNVYILTKAGTDISKLDQKIARTFEVPVNITDAGLKLIPLKELHLYDTMTGNAKLNLIALLAGGVIALLLSCFNYINLSTILFSTRSKEIGISKTIGARKIDVIKQFLADTFITGLMGFILALIMLKLIFPAVNSLFHVELRMFSELNVVLLIASVFILTILLAGFYPADTLSKVQPLFLMSRRLGKRSGKNRFVQTLVTTQFVVALVLIHFMIVMFKQMAYQTNYDVTGYDGTNVISVNGYPWGDLNLVKEELMKNPQIEEVSWGSRLPGMSMGMTTDWKEVGNQEMAFRFWIEGNYFNVFRIKMLEGRSFSSELEGEDQNGVIINRITANSLNYKDPVGKPVMIRGQNFTIIGVVDNYQATPPVYDNLPYIILKSDVVNENLLIRINGENRDETVAYIQEVLRSKNPEMPVDISFYNDLLDQLYAQYLTVQPLIRIFTLIIIFNAAIGLFGLSFFLAQRKNKEISIRKVHGASVSETFWQLTRGFVVKLIIAFCISTFLVYFGGQRFLTVFPRHITLGAGIFLSGGLIALIMLSVSVGIKIWHTARRNPVEALRYE